MNIIVILAIIGGGLAMGGIDAVKRHHHNKPSHITGLFRHHKKQAPTVVTSPPLGTRQN